MRVLVTGGAGFVGSHTVDLLLSHGLDVIVLDNLDGQVHQGGGFPANLKRHETDAHLEVVRADVRDAEAVGRALDGVEAILHLAAAVGVGQSMYEPRHYADANLTGTAALLQCVLERRPRLRKLVVASSMSIYGEGAYRCPSCREDRAVSAAARRFDGGWEPRCSECGVPLRAVPTGENKPLEPSSIYAITKRTQEEMILCFGRAYAVPAVALRYFNIYGPRQALSNPYTGVIAIFLSRLLNGRAPLVFEDGLQTRDFIHVSDIANANVAALTSAGDDPAVLNVGTGRPTTVVELARSLAAALDIEAAPVMLQRLRVGDVRHCCAATEAIQRRLGWEARVDLRDGLADVLDWARDQRPVDRADDAMRELLRQGLVQ